MWTPQLESTHRELSFEWSHLLISLDSSGFESFLGLVKFTFGIERVNKILQDLGIGLLRSSTWVVLQLSRPRVFLAFFFRLVRFTKKDRNISF